MSEKKQDRSDIPAEDTPTHLKDAVESVAGTATEPSASTNGDRGKSKGSAGVSTVDGAQGSSSAMADDVEDTSGAFQTLFIGPVVGIYRFLRSMRTALVLLLILAIASIVGTLLPQEAQNQQGVQMFQQNYPNLSQVLAFLQLYDLYGSWWFQVIIALLVASLLSCVLPRTKAVVRKLRSKQAHVGERFLKKLPNSVQLEVSLPHDDALGRAGEILGRHRFSPKKMEGEHPVQLFARKGRFGDMGSLFFHYSMLLLLVAAIFGKATGFEGQAFIVEGERWVEQHLQYDSLAEGKLYARADNHKGFEIQVDDFTTQYYGADRGFMPKDFISTVSVYDGGKRVRKEEIRVNGKLYYKGVKFYQSSYGWAPHVKVAQAKSTDGKRAEELLYDKPAIFFGDNKLPNGMQAQGQFTIPENPDPGDPQQLSVEAIFAPDVDLTKGQPRSPFLKNPALIVTLRKGADQSLVGQEIITGKNPVKIGDYVVSMPEVKEWTGLEVNSDPGVPAIYTAFTIMVLGMVVSLYMSHRRVWVAALPGSKGKNTTTLVVSGIAEKNKSGFEIEFERLVDDLKDSLEAKEPEQRTDEKPA